MSNGSSPGPAPAPLSLKERLAALNSAGMDTTTSKKNPKEDSINLSYTSSSSSRIQDKLQASDATNSAPRLHPKPTQGPKPTIAPVVVDVTLPVVPSSTFQPPPGSPALSGLSEPSIQHPARPSAPPPPSAQTIPPPQSPVLVEHTNLPSSLSHQPSNHHSIAHVEPPIPNPKPSRMSHHHSTSLPPSRHPSPPQIPAKLPSLANYTPPSRSSEFTPTTIFPPSPSFEEPENFSSHFPSLSEFESLPGLQSEEPSSIVRSPKPLPTAPSSAGFGLPSVSTLPPPSRKPTDPSQVAGSYRPNQNVSPHSPTISPNHTSTSLNSFSSSPSQLASNTVSSASMTPSSSSSAKIDFPFVNRISPVDLQQYLDGGIAKLLILDIRPKEAFEADHVGKGRQEVKRVETINIESPWLDEYK